VERQHVAVAQALERPFDEHAVRKPVRRKLVPQHPGVRPAHVLVAARRGRGERVRRRLPARRLPHRVETAAGQRAQARIDALQLVADSGRVEHVRLPAVDVVHPPAVEVGAKPPVMPGVRAEGVPLGRARTPVLAPGRVERAVAAEGLLVGEKEGGAHVVPGEDARDGLGLRHAARGEREIERAGARRRGVRRGRHGEPAKEPGGARAQHA